MQCWLREMRVLMADMMSWVPYYCRCLLDGLRQAGLTTIEYATESYRYDNRGSSACPVWFRDPRDGISRLPKAIRNARRVGYYIRNLNSMVRHARQYDLIHVQWLPLVHTGGWERAFMARAANRTKVLYTVHNYLPHDTGTRYWQAYRDLYSVFHGLFVHCAHLRDQLVGEMGLQTPIHPIKHGQFGTMRVPSTAVDKPWAPLFLLQGAIKAYKGVDTLLDAWTEVERTHPSARLRIVGPVKPRMHAHIRNVMAERRYSRLEYCSRFLSDLELEQEYQQADVLLYPYLSSSSSGALMMGLQYCKPMILSDIPVFRETLQDGQNCLMFPCGDAEARASVMVEAAQNRPRCQQMADTLYRTDFGAYTWESVGRATLQVYSSV